MADDWGSAEGTAAREAARRTQAPIVRQPAVGAASSARRQSFVFKHWRPLMFLAILLVAADAGLYFKSHANPAAEPASFRDHPPQYINVYETNPDIPLAVTVNLYQAVPFFSPVGLSAHGFMAFDVVVNVTATPARSLIPGTMMITSSIVPVDTFFRVKGPAGQLKFAVPVSLYRINRTTWTGQAGLGTIPVIFQSNGSSFGHLPSVGALYYPLGPGLIPHLGGFYKPRTGQVRGVFNLDYLLSHHAIPSGDRTEYFWSPPKVSYTEILNNIVPVLRDEPIDYSIPPLNSANARDYIWYSRTTLNSGAVLNQEPIFKATNPDAVNSQNQASFISGIAFGVAGAAAITIIQELPKELPGPASWPRGKRRRKRLASQDDEQTEAQPLARSSDRPEGPSTGDSATPAP